jgi:tRNA threonylcarbamoyladenosine biosynthesis protein TsaB
VALSKNDELIALKEINNGYSHAENLHVFIQQLMDENHLQMSQLGAISVSSGPGSYTGLRIGFSAAKGIAFALNIPLITVDTLKILAVQAIYLVKADAIYVPLMDARRMEVYCAVYDKSLREVLSGRALILTDEAIEMFREYKPLYFFGDGMPKSRVLLSGLENVNFIDGIAASSEAMVALAYQKYISNEFADVAYTEPNYLKEFYFTSDKK